MAPSTSDEHQEAADEEEARGGKWRAGDPIKAARAFQRALTLYDNGLQQFPNDFDLAYNKARLLLEISQQPALLPHWSMSHADFLVLTLAAHRRALVLNDGEVDLLFNTAQVLTSLAEELSDADRESEAVPLLHETLELLSSCLAKQEMSLEQQSLDVTDNEEEQGGVPIDNAGSMSDANQESPEEVTATVIHSTSPNDLLDTVHASLSALTTLLPLEGGSALSNLNSMALMLIDTKAPSYIALLSTEEQVAARAAILLDRAIFVTALANARYGFHDLNLKTYVEALSAFDQPGSMKNAQALSKEAEARSELVLSVLDRTAGDVGAFLTDCWRQLSQAQDLLSQATKLESEDAKQMRAELYKAKADTELLRVRIASLPDLAVTPAMRNSGPALLKNARTFYKAAVGSATAAGDSSTASSASDRLGVVQFLIDVDGEHEQPQVHAQLSTFEDLADEGLIDRSLLERIASMLS